MFCQLPLSYVVLHGRAASHHPQSQLLDLGAVRVENGLMAEHFYTLLRPEGALDDSMVTPLELSPARLRSAPGIAQIMPVFRRFVRDLPIMLLNRDPFLPQFHHALRATHCDQPLRLGMDVQSMAYCLHPEWFSFALPDMATLLGLPMPLHPDAWSEAVVALYCMERMRNDKEHAKDQWLLIRNRLKEDSPVVPGWRRLKMPDLSGARVLVLGDLARLESVQARQALLLCNAELVQLPQAAGLTHVVAGVPGADKKAAHLQALKVIRARQTRGESIRVLDEEGLLHLLGYRPSPARPYSSCL